MAKKAQRKPASPSDWVKLLDAAAIEAAWDDAVVDAYDDDEQSSSLMDAIENELQFPFSAKVMGLDVSIVGAEQPQVGRGLDLIVERNDQKHRIEARSVELVPPLPSGAEILAAYVTRSSVGLTFVDSDSHGVSVKVAIEIYSPRSSWRSEQQEQQQQQ